MTRSTLLRTVTWAASFGFAPLALAQDAATPPPWSFIATLGGFGMLLALGIIGIIFVNEARKARDRLALVEKLASEGKPVPRELMVNEPPKLSLPEERRRDIRRAITLIGWGIGIAVVFYILSGGNPRAAAWGLILIVPGIGNFVKAWLTARDIARGSAGGPR